MKKLDKLWDRFNKIEDELKKAHDPAEYEKKKEELLDVYEEIQRLEDEVQSWGASAS